MMCYYLNVQFQGQRVNILFSTVHVINTSKVCACRYDMIDYIFCHHS